MFEQIKQVWSKFQNAEPRVKSALWFLLSTAIIGAMIYFADFSRFVSAVNHAKISVLIPAFALGLSVFSIWAFTWYSFFEKMGLNISYQKSLRLFMAGNFLNSVTPLGQFGGEPFMAYIISENTEASKEKAFSTVLSADIVNAVPMFTFILGGSAYLMIFGASVNQMVIETLYVAILTTVIGGGIVYLLWFETGKIEGGILRFLEKTSDLLGRGKGIVDKAEKSLNKVEESFSTVGESPIHLVRTAVVAHLGFIFQLFCLYLILLSVGHPTNFTPLYFVITLSAFGNFSPTPGGSGTFEAIMAGLLTVFISIDFATALVVAILFRLTTYWPGLIIGYLSLNSLESGGS